MLVFLGYDGCYRWLMTARLDAFDLKVDLAWVLLL